MSEVRFAKRVDWGIVDGRGKHQVALQVSRFEGNIELRGVTTHEHWAAQVSIPLDELDAVIAELNRMRGTFAHYNLDCPSKHADRGDGICIDCGKDLL